MAGDLRSAIERELPALVTIRHDLHRHPELSDREHRTARVIRRELESLGIQLRDGYAGGTGIVAHLPSTQTGGAGSRDGARAVALRADMDALPIQETSGRPHASTVPDVMHACGHDGHMTIVLGVARVLSRLPDRPNPVTFIFQPAEEDGGGAERMCDQGCLLGEAGGGLGPPVDRIYGMHSWPQLEAGTVATRPGPLLAATDDFDLVIRGTQAHAAYPHLGADPVLAAAHVITAVQSIASRNASPLDAIVVTIGMVEGGSANNIIPERVRMIGTIRTLTPETRRLARERFHGVVEQAAAALGCHAEIDYLPGYPVTSNDPDLVEHALGVARDALGAGRAIVQPSPSMGGEDFSYYGQHVPACFCLLGTRPPGVERVPQLHQPDFDFNDEALPTGVELMCRLALAER